MHEWSLAQSVIYTAIKYKKEKKLKKITDIHVVLGELQQIEEDIFQFGLDEIAKQKNIKAKIQITIDPAVLQCRICSFRWNFKEAIKSLGKDEVEYIHFIPDVAHIYVRCPECKSSDFKVIKGRGVEIESIKGLK